MAIPQNPMEVIDAERRRVLDALASLFENAFSG
jgi:hypothetical protein